VGHITLTQSIDQVSQFSSYVCSGPSSHLTTNGKSFPYSLPSVGPEADPGLQAVSLASRRASPPLGRPRGVMLCGSVVTEGLAESNGSLLPGG